jgi:AraC-like DNA-binding protein
MVTLISNQQLNYYREAVIEKSHSSSKLIFSDVFKTEKSSDSSCELKRLKPHAKVVVMQHSENLNPLEFLIDHQLENQEVDEDFLMFLQKIKLYQNNLQKKSNDYDIHFPERISPKYLEGTNAVTHQANDKQSDFLEKLQSSIEPMLYDATLDVEKICHLVGISKTNLFSKLKALTGQSITIYIRKLRLAKSRELLATTEMTVAEVAYSVGFNDPKYFTRVFTEEYGKSPKETKVKK